jgi:hypothetical protein
LDYRTPEQIETSHSEDKGKATSKGEKAAKAKAVHHDKCLPFVRIDLLETRLPKSCAIR